jgi:hypothetical protein
MLSIFAKNEMWFTTVPIGRWSKLQRPQGLSWYLREHRTNQPSAIAAESSRPSDSIVVMRQRSGTVPRKESSSETFSAERGAKGSSGLWVATERRTKNKEKKRSFAFVRLFCEGCHMGEATRSDSLVKRAANTFVGWLSEVFGPAPVPFASVARSTPTPTSSLKARQNSNGTSTSGDVDPLEGLLVDESGDPFEGDTPEMDELGYFEEDPFDDGSPLVADPVKQRIKSDASLSRAEKSRLSRERRYRVVVFQSELLEPKAPFAEIFPLF